MPRRIAPALLSVAAALPVMAELTVIAHRGASGYLPEHTLEAAAYAHALGTDFVEQDVVLTRDDVLIVNHDIEIDTTTDVAARFPGRAREDGRFYAIDFTWSELQTLRVRERFNPLTQKPVYPLRFPHRAEGSFRLCTFEEQLHLIQGLNRSTDRTVGVYPEIKAPAWHAAAGKDPGAELLRLLEKFGYAGPDAAVFVQCFDPAELRRLRFERKTRLPLIQLLDTAVGPEELAAIAGYAQGIGPPLDAVLVSPGRPSTGLTAAAHAVGLLVHPYTVRADALPPGYATLPALLEDLARDQVNGVFTDHADQVRDWRQGRP